MSGNAALDRQIAQAMMPQYNPMQAIQQMQRQPVQIQPIQNPIFGGNIPMNFGLPQQAQMPAGYQSPMAMYRPAAFDSYRPAPPVMTYTQPTYGGDTGHGGAD